MTLTAREWLDAANWQVNDEEQRQRLADRVGADKADEFVATVDRLATNLLYTLDTIKMSEETMMKFNLTIANIALDNVLPHERGT